jgi:hypothetical protein
MAKLDLTVLKTFVAEVEKAAEAAHNKYDEKSDSIQTEYLVELAKMAGLLVSVVQEANLLVGDVQRTIKNSSSPKPSQAEIQKMMSKLYGVPDDDDFQGGFGGGFKN